jgi:UDP-glucose 4-epimerase
MENDTAIGEIFNIGNDEEVSVIDSAHMIHELAHTGKELKLKFVPFEGVFGKGYKDIMRRLPDLSKAKSILRYSPKIGMREAIELTIASIKNHQKNVC